MRHGAQHAHGHQRLDEPTSSSSPDARILKSWVETYRTLDRLSRIPLAKKRADALLVFPGSTETALTNSSTYCSVFFTENTSASVASGSFRARYTSASVQCGVLGKQRGPDRCVGQHPALILEPGRRVLEDPLGPPHEDARERVGAVGRRDGRSRGVLPQRAKQRGELQVFEERSPAAAIRSVNEGCGADPHCQTASSKIGAPGFQTSGVWSTNHTRAALS